MQIRVSICASADNAGEVEEAESWLERNRAALSYVSDMNGCGCCVVSWEVEGPEHVIDTLPPYLRAAAPAGSAIPCQKDQPQQDQLQQRRQAGHPPGAVGTPGKPAAGAMARRAAIAPSVSTGSIVLLGVFYLILALPTLRLGIAVYTPCVSNFEGGCSMGKGIAAVITLVTATGAFGLGIVLMTQLTAHPTIAATMRGAIRLAHLLWLAPLAYFLFTLHALF